MPSRALRVCNVPGCPEFTKQGKCDEHRRAAERRRGSAHQRGYGQAHAQRFRRGVLDRDPICVECRGKPATVADHYPKTRRQLVDEGLDPNDPANGRGLCEGCHNRHTARTRPDAWGAQ